MKAMQASLQVCITWAKKFGMLIILNLGIIVVDFSIVVDFDVNLSIFVVDCR